jgi:Flp pilus assembly protein TadB
MPYVETNGATTVKPVKRSTDADFDWGDESYLHRVGRGARVVLAFVLIAVVVFAIAALLAFLLGNVWLALGALLLIAGVVELVAREVRRRKRAVETDMSASTDSDH